MNNSLHYNYMARKLRQFFQEEKGFVEVPAFSRLSIMAACEDPRTITKFNLGGLQWPCAQTGQMWLEVELLKNPQLKGVFCTGPSFRDEPNIIEGRHRRLFPMFDFEGQGDFNELKKIESELLQFLGFEAPTSLLYEDACKDYGTQTIEHDQEVLMCKTISPAISLEKFPTRTSPFWNMRYAGNGIFNKIDIILYGMETIGSAERSCSVTEMKEFFSSISNGEYAQLLFDHFGKERVMNELDEYFSFDFFPRFGGGIGMTRLEHAMSKAGLFKDFIPQTTVQSPRKYGQASL